MQRLAAEMAKAVLARLNNNKSLLEMANDSHNLPNLPSPVKSADLTGRGSAPNTGGVVDIVDIAVARQEAAIRCQELEARLKQTHEEEKQCRLRLAERFEADCNAHAEAFDAELLRIRQEHGFVASAAMCSSAGSDGLVGGADGMMGPHVGIGDGGDLPEHAELHRDFADCAHRIRQNIENAQGRVVRLETKRRDVEAVERQQSRGLSHLDDLSQGDEQCDVDRTLAELIRQGERSSRRT